MKENDFIKWTGIDNEGEEFSHVGQILRLNDEKVHIQLPNCSIYIPRDDGHFEPAEKPEDWSYVAPTPTPRVAAKPAKVRVRAKKEGKTKPELVADLFRDDVPTSRSEAIKLIVASGICGSAAAASTAWNSAKKLLK